MTETKQKAKANTSSILESRGRERKGRKDLLGALLCAEYIK